MKKDWEIKTLGEVCEVVGGGTPKTEVSEYWTDEVVWVTPKDLGQLTTVEIFNTAKMISRKGLEKSSAKLLPVGSVVMSSRAPIGYVAIAGIELATNQGCRNFICGNKIYNKYLYYFLFFNTELLNSLGGGATFKEISGTTLKGVEIPLPSVNEQKRIVGILDEKFKVIEELKKVTEAQINDAEELFQSRLNEVFDGDKSWGSDILKNLTSKIGSGATPRGGEKSYKEEGISLIRSLNVYDNEFKIRKLAFIDNDQATLLSNVDVKENDVLFNITGASIARCTIVPNIILPARVNQHVSILRPIKDQLDPKFLMYLLISKHYKKILLSTGEGAGATRQAITKAQLESFEIRYPVAREQKNIVKELDDLSQKTKELEVIFRRKVADLEELKKSYLEQAFAGKL